MQLSLVGIKVTVDARQFIAKLPRSLWLTAVFLGKAAYFVVYLAACLALFGILINITHHIFEG